MSKLYTINPGFSFVDLVEGKRVVKTGGEQIALAEDCAAEHAEKITPVQAPAPDVAETGASDQPQVD